MLYELLDGAKTLSVIGMCKNAGKTTVLNSLISECESHDEVLGLTSIGRDGERSDLVTNTKKPEIFVRRGAVIATASSLLKLCDISMEILSATGVPTPMGEIVIVRARSAGFVQLGGASITEQQKRIRDELFSFGCSRVFIDGALSRKSLGAPEVCDAAILSVGASFGPDIGSTVAEAAHTARLFGLPETDAQMGAGRFTAIRGDDMASSDELNALVPFIKEGADKLALRGAVTDGTASALVTVGRLLKDTLLVAEDASRLLLKASNFDKLLRFTRGFGVKKGARLIAVTVNPFSAYGLHYDKNEFRERIAAALGGYGMDIPVMDVENA